ncbi:hypothetical protein DFH09DRAFT_1076305 [Mycena vulgaris]|nr:hypothetical protein DFH09DRAFT_1076305 [Mycena vulgaris]
MYALSEHPLYDSETKCPPPFNTNLLNGTFVSEDEAQSVAARAKRVFLQLVGWISWWTTSVSKWNRHVEPRVVTAVNNLQLQGLRKQGVIAYQDAFNRKNDGLALWMSDLPIIQSELQKCLGFSEFLEVDERNYKLLGTPYPRPDNPDVETTAIDHEGWLRRKLKDVDEWITYLKLYHHCVVEIMDDDDDDLPRENGCMIREIYKGRCAPKRGQIYDFTTGVKRRNPYEGPEQLTKLRTEGALLDRAEHLGGCSLNLCLGDIGINDSVDTTQLGCMNLDDSDSTGTDTSKISERRETDRNEPMRFQSNWARLMTRDNSADGYKQVRGRHFIEYETNTRCRPATRLGNRERSRSPSFNSVRSGTREASEGSSSKAIMRRIPIDASISYQPCRELRFSNRKLWDMRAAWLRDFHLWGRAMTYEQNLWTVPSEYKLRFMCHVLSYAIEHGVTIRIGVKPIDAKRYRPCTADYANNVVNKCLFEPASKAPRLARDLSPMELFTGFAEILDSVAKKPNACKVIGRGGGASWIMCYFGYLFLHSGIGPPRRRKRLRRSFPLDLSWDELSERDLHNIFGYVAGDSGSEDAYIFPMDDMMLEFSAYYYYEWNAGCDRIFRHLAEELVARRGEARTRKDWRKYLKSTNHGVHGPLTGGKPRGLWIYKRPSLMTSNHDPYSVQRELFKHLATENIKSLMTRTQNKRCKDF